MKKKKRSKTSLLFQMGAAATTYMTILLNFQSFRDMPITWTSSLKLHEIFSLGNKTSNVWLDHIWISQNTLKDYRSLLATSPFVELSFQNTTLRWQFHIFGIVICTSEAIKFRSLIQLSLFLLRYSPVSNNSRFVNAFKVNNCPFKI